ncbi:MAG: uroporphyrinogen-III synthase [Bacteroidota bacterium]|nr:uroporphyrinogen-III synthase [Bacteroidota bacterium]
MAKKVLEKRTPAKKKSEVKSIKKAVKPAKKAAAVIPKKKEKTPKAVKSAKITKSTPAPKAKQKVIAPEPVLPSVLKPSSKNDKKIVVESRPLPEIVNPDKLKPVKSILISQPKPESGKSPYIDLAEQFKIKLDWRPFTHVEGIKAPDFRKQKIYIDQYSCIIFTSRVAIEQYFRICDELRVKISEDNRYFCLSETIALYLQKFIQYRKRKVFYGDGKLPKLIEVILKHKEDGKFLLPCSDQRDKALAELLVKHNITYNEAVIYNTAASDLSDLGDVKYDMLVFFNSSGIDSLFTNFPKFEQGETRIGIFGNSTAEAVKAHKLHINIFAPTPENPSLVDAIKKYITKSNKKR